MLFRYFYAADSSGAEPLNPDFHRFFRPSYSNYWISPILVGVIFLLSRFRQLKRFRLISFSLRIHLPALADNTQPMISLITTFMASRLSTLWLLLALDRQGYYQYTHPLFFRTSLDCSLKNNPTRPGKSANIPHHSLTWLPDFEYSFPFLR